MILKAVEHIAALRGGSQAQVIRANNGAYSAEDMARLLEELLSRREMVPQLVIGGRRKKAHARGEPKGAELLSFGRSLPRAEGKSAKLLWRQRSGLAFPACPRILPYPQLARSIRNPALTGPKQNNSRCFSKKRTSLTGLTGCEHLAGSS